MQYVKLVKQDEHLARDLRGKEMFDKCRTQIGYNRPCGQTQLCDRLYFTSLCVTEHHIHTKLGRVGLSACRTGQSGSQSIYVFCVGGILHWEGGIVNGYYHPCRHNCSSPILRKSRPNRPWPIMRSNMVLSEH